jgi:hypothetical protein
MVGRQQRLQEEVSLRPSRDFAPRACTKKGFSMHSDRVHGAGTALAQREGQRQSQCSGWAAPMAGWQCRALDNRGVT